MTMFIKTVQYGKCDSDLVAFSKQMPAEIDVGVLKVCLPFRRKHAGLFVHIAVSSLVRCKLICTATQSQYRLTERRFRELTGWTD
jgi:hypothetical protein